ncbi:hypothetical protein TWF102_001822 [Orbilia oligospora]|uniref:Peptide N-acetyl-beta-D-glucosaminyl asparaginase amidase A N-terminal domain-containing protein n=1 Tax=Orbilia oligospora TaxID=2813651 RepID=A0A7C8NGV5_ORBOL|nr:hypothetical protein TWF706_007877 [Orbilia oligospora]KAF3105918.1 hypothetical protein TWF102_001822 [Orbilia oligospora]KAF3112580.1 hypothetical protein TWF103_002827 [Orbilia oligospora]KAF3136871.1 hypothetical protein TWF594_007758 [Orbilia oligospora]
MVHTRYFLGHFGLYQASTWGLALLPILSLGFQAPYPEQHQVSPSVDGDLTEFFQLYKPPLVPLSDTSSPHDDFSGEACSSTILQHEFINSYGKPAVAQYSPPPPSCEWNTVYFHLYTTSKGRQYDRLAFLFFDDTELWRTSTAEPIPNGISFQYTKDVTPFSTLLRGNGTIIFDMGNMVTDILTGTFAVTLTAHYFKLDLSPQQKVADVVVPISRMQGSNGQPSHFVLPNDVAGRSFSVPKNVKTAKLSIIASGNAEEEFWYTNVPDGLVNSFPNNTLLGHSPYREVQVYVDRIMVDAIVPVPTIYTGGINPGLWKPVVCPHAYDLWEAEIDITLFVAGKANAVIEFRVEGLTSAGGRPEIGGGIGQNWYVSGTTFFWTDPEAPKINPSEYSVEVFAAVGVDWAADGDGDDQLVNYRTSVHRRTVISRDFLDGRLWWERSQRYEVKGILSASGNNQTLQANTQAFESFQTQKEKKDSPSPRNIEGNGWTPLRKLEFSLRMDQAFVPYPDKSFFLHGRVNSGYLNYGPESTLLTDRSTFFLNEFPRKELGVNEYTDRRFLDDEASYFSAATGSNKTSWINGASNQGYSYEIGDGSFTTERTVKKYSREMRSVYARVTSDIQSINGIPVKQSIPDQVSSNNRGLFAVEVEEEELICARLPHRRGKSIFPAENSGLV